MNQDILVLRSCSLDGAREYLPRRRRLDLRSGSGYQRSGENKDDRRTTSGFHWCPLSSRIVALVQANYKRLELLFPE